MIIVTKIVISRKRFENFDAFFFLGFAIAGTIDLFRAENTLF